MSTFTGRGLRHPEKLLAVVTRWVRRSQGAHARPSDEATHQVLSTLALRHVAAIPPQQEGWQRDLAADGDIEPNPGPPWRPRGTYNEGHPPAPTGPAPGQPIWPHIK
eukprot:13646232-Alexandrium_andersonii.AAC.1